MEERIRKLEQRVRDHTKAIVYLMLAVIALSLLLVIVNERIVP